MNNFIITVARSHGSGGKGIAKALAKELGYEFYDREIIRMASEDSGINEALFNRVEENENFKRRRGYFKAEVVGPRSKEFTSVENLYNLQREVVKKIVKGDKGAVIVGRTAHNTVSECPNAIKVFLYADEDYCIKTICRTDGVNEDEAREIIKKTDTYRAEYCKYFTGRDWDEVDNYDLCLNVTNLTVEQTISLIKNYIEIVKDRIEK